MLSVTLCSSILLAASHCGRASSDFAEVPADDGEYHALHLLQDVAGLNLMRSALRGSQPRPQAAVEFEDVSSLAQTGVSIEKVPTQTWGAAQAEEEEEEATCSLQGLTPGICAMAALAQEAPTGEQGKLDFYRPERLERALFKEIESALAGTHKGFTAANITKLESELKGMFNAMPKNEAGLLSTATARYALHQRFLRRSAWYIRSLNPAGEAQKPASEGEELRGHVPQHLLELLDRHTAGRGLGLREFTVLVATLDHLIQGDLGERLKAAYASHELQHNTSVEAFDVTEVLLTFMAHFLSLQHRSGYAITPQQAMKERRDIERNYGGWTSVIEFVEAAVGEGPEDGAGREPVPFSEALSMAQDVMARFGSYSVDECRGVKALISNLPGGASGHVRLSDFHQAAANGQSLFGESSEYLNQLGALDRSRPGDAHVLLPNYIYSPSNCVGTTSFFDMCCPNECEAILQDIEQILQTPEATSHMIEAALTGRTQLSDSLKAELDAQAEAHGGRIGLHGYHFANWLHQAFPRECPRPRSTDFRTHGRQEAEVPNAEQEFQAVANVSILATKAELYQELVGNASVAAPSRAQEVKDSDGDSDLEAAAAKAMGLASSGSTKGLKIGSRLDAASLAQTGVEVTSAAEDGEATEEDVDAAPAEQPRLATKDGSNTLRVRLL